MEAIIAREIVPTVITMKKDVLSWERESLLSFLRIKHVIIKKTNRK
jgi:hypothetical protein